MSGSRNPRSSQLATIWALLCALTAGCSIIVGPAPASPRLHQPARPIAIDTIDIADDGRSAQIRFTGGREFDPQDPCSFAYTAEVEVTADELRLAVLALEHPLWASYQGACTLEGHLRTLAVALDPPFHGTRVIDRAGYVILLAAPQGLVRLHGLPEGWELRRQESLAASPTGRWSRTYSPVADPGRDDPSLQLIQAFGGPADVSGGDLQPDQLINGVRATFYLYPPSGEMVLVWFVGDDGVALVGNLREFSKEEFVRLAMTVVPPGD